MSLAAPDDDARGDELPTAAELEALHRRLPTDTSQPGREPDEMSRWRDTGAAARLVAATPRLRMRPGIQLVTYVVRQGIGGNGITWAFPADAVLPPAEDVVDTHGARDPDAAIGTALAAVVGDGTPAAYVWASLLGRELDDLGAYRHGCSWVTHRLLGEPGSARELRSSEAADEDAPRPPAPWSDRSDGGPFDADPAWTWHAPHPTRWEPDVRTAPDGTVAVTLHSYSDLGAQVIVRHVDWYPGDGDLVPATVSEELLATGSRGLLV